MTQSTKLTKITKYSQRIVILITQIFIAIIVAWLALRFYPGDRWLPVRLGSYVAPWFFMGLIPSLIITLLVRRRGWSLIALLLFIHFAGHYAPLFIPNTPSVSAGNQNDTLKVMTYNVHYSNRNAAEIANLIRREQPDIIALQELTDDLAGLLLPKLVDDYPYMSINHAYERAPALISRYPLETKETPAEIWRSQHVIVKMPQASLNLWNVHPPPPIKPGRWEIQTDTLTGVARTLDDEAGPTIVLGDFNATDKSESYHLIDDHLTDVHQVVGKGFEFTFGEPDVVQSTLPSLAFATPLMKPFARIDHIFASEHFVPVETHVIPNGLGSDHRPVVTTLRFAAD